MCKINCYVNISNNETNKIFKVNINSFLQFQSAKKDLYLVSIGGPEKGRLGRLLEEGHSLLGAGVLGDGLGSLRDSVLGKLTGQEEPDGGLDLPGGDGGPLVVVGKTAGLSSDALKEVIDKGVHDAHGL